MSRDIYEKDSPGSGLDEEFERRKLKIREASAREKAPFGGRFPISAHAREVAENPEGTSRYQGS